MSRDGGVYHTNEPSMRDISTFQLCLSSALQASDSGLGLVLSSSLLSPSVLFFSSLLVFSSSFAAAYRLKVRRMEGGRGRRKRGAGDVVHTTKLVVGNTKAGGAGGAEEGPWFTRNSTA